MSQTKKILIFSAIVVAVVVWESLGDLFISYPIVNYPAASPVILAWGDSLSVGVGASNPQLGYLELLRERLHANIVNKAVSGETSEATLLHADKDIAEVQPGIVLILIGGNDLLAGTPADTTLQNTQKLIHIAQQGKAAVYLVGFQKHQGDAYAIGFKKLAKESGTFYTPDILGDIIGNAQFMSDEVHPNDKGYLKMADKIAYYLESLILSSDKSLQATSH
jgi:lysophospholipase L1-like esterase